jgi:hypothetical protein
MRAVNAIYLYQLQIHKTLLGRKFYMKKREEKEEYTKRKVKSPQRSVKPPESTSLSKLFSQYTDNEEMVLCWKLKYNVVLPSAVHRYHQQVLTVSVLPQQSNSGRRSLTSVICHFRLLSYFSLHSLVLYMGFLEKNKAEK